MSDLALLVGIGEEELSKALIRGVPVKLRWHYQLMTMNDINVVSEMEWPQQYREWTSG